MTTNFPTSLDALSNPASGDLQSTGHAAQHGNLNDAMEAVQARVGITGSADATSLTKRIAVLEAAGGSGMTYCLLAGGGSESTSTSTLTRLTATTWNTEQADASGWHDPVTNNSRITVPSAGLYMVTAQVYFNGVAGVGGREAIIYKNGVYHKAGHLQATTAADLVVPVTAILPLSTSDYIEIFAYQTSGVSCTVGGNVAYNWFQVTRLSS